MSDRFYTSITAIVLVICGATGFVNADERAPQGVADGIEKPLRIAPRPGNDRNSEGDFIQLHDGRLMLVYTKFVGKSDHATAELVARYSTDQGKTWTSDDVAIVARAEGQANLMSVSLLRLQDGRIALFYILKYPGPADAKYPVLDSLLLRTSDDDGKTWSEATHVTPQDQPAYRVLNNDRVIQLMNGRLVVPVATHYVPGWSGWRNSAQIHCYLSDDNGITWRSSSTTLESELLAQEPGVVELSDGRLMMFCRSQDCQLVSHSTDRGETWSALKRSSIAQPSPSPASIERIPSTNDLLLLWNNGDDPLAQIKPVGRRPFTAAISSDDGATWKHVQNIGTDPEGWYCYTAIEFVGEHVLLAHCEYPRLNSLQITRLPVKWLYRTSQPEASSKSLPQVVLLGDSIRMNYQAAVISTLAEKADVWSPKDNCKHTTYMLENIDRWLDGQDPRIIHVNVGLHDMYLDAKTGKPRHTLETYEQNLRAIFVKLRERTDAKIIFALTTVVDEQLQEESKGYGRVVRRNTDIETYNATARRVAKELGIVVNDLNAFMAKAGPENILRPSDGIHLSAEGCELLGREVARVILKELQP
jgi:hypothetical protein